MPLVLFTRQAGPEKQSDMYALITCICYLVHLHTPVCFYTEVQPSPRNSNGHPQPQYGCMTRPCIREKKKKKKTKQKKKQLLRPQVYSSQENLRQGRTTKLIDQTSFNVPAQRAGDPQDRRKGRSRRYSSVSAGCRDVVAVSGVCKRALFDVVMLVDCRHQLPTPCSQILCLAKAPGKALAGNKCQPYNIRVSETGALFRSNWGFISSLRSVQDAVSLGCNVRVWVCRTQACHGQSAGMTPTPVKQGWMEAMSDDAFFVNGADVISGLCIASL